MAFIAIEEGTNRILHKTKTKNQCEYLTARDHPFRAVYYISLANQKKSLSVLDATDMGDIFAQTVGQRPSQNAEYKNLLMTLFTVLHGMETLTPAVPRPVKQKAEEPEDAETTETTETTETVEQADSGDPEEVAKKADVGKLKKPSPTTVTGQCWALYDSVGHAIPNRQVYTDYAVQCGVNPSTAKTQFSKWLAYQKENNPPPATPDTTPEGG